jgi:transcription initiation factor TFIID subunit 11
VSGTNSAAPTKKKRGRKSKKDKSAAGDSSSQAPSQAGGKAATSVSGHGGDKDKDGQAGDEDEDDENGEMAVEQVGARTEEQKQEEIRLRAMLVEAFDSEQYSRYELWRAAKLSDAVVKRVVNATVSQSVPQNVSTAVKAVAKLFAGEIIEAARNVQGEWIAAGEKQSDLPTPPPDTSAAAAAAATTTSQGAEGDAEDTAAKADKQGEEAPEPRRGPLRPDHLREAWRRYRISGESRGVGVQQLWHAQQGNGVERFSTRTGKRLFK